MKKMIQTTTAFSLVAAMMLVLTPAAFAQGDGGSGPYAAALSSSRNVKL
jgi:hypothetical protein